MDAKNNQIALTPNKDPKQAISVSAIATTLNCREGLRECVEMLSLEMNFDLFREIVIVDGGSTDGTWEILQDLAQNNPAIRVFQEKGANISRGRNLAVAHSHGNIILSFDSGCTMSDHFVMTMIQPFLDDPECDVVGAKTVAVGITHFEKAVAALQQGTLKDTFNPSSRAIAFRRKVFDAVGGYDESVLAGEDTHFNHKWRNAGFKYVHVPEARVYWRVRSSLRALYKMQRRNVTGSVALNNPWGLVGWSVRLSVESLIIGILGILARLAGLSWGWYACGIGFGGWLAYVLFRTMRRKRWRTFIHPITILYAIQVILAMDLGTCSGTLHGWAQRWKNNNAK